MVKIFADGADPNGILEMNRKPYISGFTTNPTLLRKAGITDYLRFAKDILKEVSKPISFEVIADDQDEMIRQGKLLASLAENVVVKIPVTDTNSNYNMRAIGELSEAGIKVNVTAIFTLEQVKNVNIVLENGYISIFAGRIADTGVDPLPIMERAVKLMTDNEIIWASPREVLNIYQADRIGCHIITVTNDLLKKLALKDKSLEEYSLETVQMFDKDAKEAGYVL